MKNIFLGLILFLIINQNSFGSDSLNIFQSPQIGLNGGMGQNSNVNYDIYAGLSIVIEKIKYETNIGYTYFSNETEFNNVKGLKYTSHGIYSDANCFVFRNFYVGARLAFSSNYILEESQIRYSNINFIKSPTHFFSMSFLPQIGLLQPITKKIQFRFQLQAGIQSLSLTQGYIITNYSLPPYDLKNNEEQLKLLYNTSIGFLIKLGS